MVKTKKIAVITTGRQDWGILRSTVKKLDDSGEFDVAVIAGGMACDDIFGNIADNIEREGLPLYRRLKWKIGADISPCTEIAEALVLTEKCFKDLVPDAVMLVGDRFETMAVAQVATLMKIPLIHLHGGEETKGAIDNQLRHAISKLSHIHFVSHEEHAQRLLHMGENPGNVHIVGAPGLDNLHRNDLPEISKILQELNLQQDKNEPLFLITYHPPTLLGDGIAESAALMAALSEVRAVCIFTMPNNDAGNFPIRKAMTEFTGKLPGKRCLVNALGEKRYWSVLRNADAVIGNSSSGVIEAPAVPVPVINIGQRQAGRAMASCIIDIPLPTREEIKAAIDRCLSPAFRQGLSNTDSLYGTGNSAEKIYNILKDTDFEKVKVKSFYEGNQLRSKIYHG